MRVSELAKELNTTSDKVLAKLKSLRLKAKDDSQELNKAVVVVVRSELAKELGKPDAAVEKTEPQIAEASKPVKAKLPSEIKTDKQELSEIAGETKAEKPASTKPTTISKPPKVEKFAEVTDKPLEASKPIRPAKVEKPVQPVNNPIEVSRPAKVKRDSGVIAEIPKQKTEPPANVVPWESAEKKPFKKRSLKSVKAQEDEEGKEGISDKKLKKGKVKLSDEPFVPVKPLPKRKRKVSGKAGDVRFGKGDSHDWDVDLEETSLVDVESKTSAPQQEDTANRGVLDESQLQTLEIKLPVTVKDFAFRIQEKTSVILKTLLQMGVFAHINQYLSEDLVKRIARDFGYNIVQVKTQEQQLIESHFKEDEDSSQLVPRAPVVTFMGHVDHGKTTLLDRIRRSKVADQEHGGITQHIGAYSVSLPKGKITFLDTPGHEAFTAMRARGAHITDLVVLVVGGDEGIMPQTEEAIDHARAANVPIVVAITKIDRRQADIDRVKKQLMEYDLTPEDWGGKTVCCGVSAITGEGVDNLLEMILLESELLELRANDTKRASGIVVEAHLSQGRGAIASLIVQSGRLHVNDIIVVGPYYCKIKAMFDDRKRLVKDVGPSTPVEILGLPGVPEAGENFYVVEEEKQAKAITNTRQEFLKDERLSSMKKVSLEDLYSQIQEGKIKELNVILKADVQGSLEALKDSLEKIPSEEVKVRFIHKGVGDVNASDVILAIASQAIIIGFNVGIGPRAQEELEKQPVDVRIYRIIYDAVNDVRKALEGLLAPKTHRKPVGRVEVRQIFKLSKAGLVAGCYVQKGRVLRNIKVDVLRNGEVVHTGTISTLKRFKDDVREVNEGFECGISVSGYDKVEVGDILDVYEVETIARSL
jgi:translation initiation factor IF-2